MKNMQNAQLFSITEKIELVIKSMKQDQRYEIGLKTIQALLNTNFKQEHIKLENSEPFYDLYLDVCPICGSDDVRLEPDYNEQTSDSEYPFNWVTPDLVKVTMHQVCEICNKRISRWVDSYKCSGK